MPVQLIESANRPPRHPWLVRIGGRKSLALLVGLWVLLLILGLQLALPERLSVERLGMILDALVQLVVAYVAGNAVSNGLGSLSSALRRPTSDPTEPPARRGGGEA